MPHSQLKRLNWNAPRSEMHDGFVVLYAADDTTAYVQRINTRDREVYCGTAPRDLTVPLLGPGFAPTIVGQYQDTELTRAFAAEVWQERFG